LKPADVIGSDAPSQLLDQIVSRLHTDGPINQEDIETLAYLKRFHPEVLATQEPKLMYLLGLFYKTSPPTDLLSLSYRIFQDSIELESGSVLTPIQSSISTSIDANKFFSFSAPTSTGKSHVLRELIKKVRRDMIIVLPSRALISEYLITIREIVQEHKDILVLQFIDDINRAKTTRRIFIITPERGGDLFRLKDRFDIELFIFDEAQISDEGARGLTFDAFVRRAERGFPDAKKVFVHPFVENPEAQLKKHGFLQDAEARVYRQSSVGKIFSYYDKSTAAFNLFSPFVENAHHKKNRQPMDCDIVRDILLAGGSVLIYVSKQFIYDRRYNKKFGKYLDLCPPLEDPEALAIVGEVERLIGASGHKSELVALMKRGVVTHHGSIPLVVRYLIEAFANHHFARICFATSTLAQGVNIPFDLVWIDNLRFYGSEENQTLGLKNLIGRAGRTSRRIDSFDYGYVVVSNCKSFVKRFSGSTTLDDISVLDDDEAEYGPDLQEFIEAVKNETINEEYSLPESRVERLSSHDTESVIAKVLDLLYRGDRLLTGDEYYEMEDSDRSLIKSSLASIFEISIGRPLGPGEESILSTAIAILLWQVQGRSFRTLLGLRHSYLTRRAEQREINRRFRLGQISSKDRQLLLENLMVRFSPIATQLPSIGANAFNRFQDQSVVDINYDLIVYDTYDYIDKVISFSLSDVYIASFDKYFIKFGDNRANSLVNFFRYGTNDPIGILLIRYGFSPENIESIIPHGYLIEHYR
jgi:hypothetical protein